MNKHLKISVIQFDISWENKDINLENISRLVNKNSETNETDIYIIPETFTTGFTMNSEAFAETTDGKTIKTIKKLSKKYDCAFFGSFICKDHKSIYNRGFFITPYSEDYYDKKHLFSIGSETDHFRAGSSQKIISYKGWNIMLQICYDLRFPVWCRNQNNEYDILLFAANWPKSRQSAWDILLRARAIENCCFVAAANRVGEDNNKNIYQGGSAIIDMKGTLLSHSDSGKEEILNHTISLDDLNKFRRKFPVWEDADNFELLNNDD